MTNSADCRQSGPRPITRCMPPMNNMQFNKPLSMEQHHQHWNQPQPLRQPHGHNQQQPQQSQQQLQAQSQQQQSQQQPPQQLQKEAKQTEEQLKVQTKQELSQQQPSQQLQKEPKQTEKQPQPQSRQQQSQQQPQQQLQQQPQQQSQQQSQQQPKQQLQQQLQEQSQQPQQQLQQQPQQQSQQQPQQQSQQQPQQQLQQQPQQQSQQQPQQQLQQQPQQQSQQQPQQQLQQQPQQQLKKESNQPEQQSQQQPQQQPQPKSQEQIQQDTVIQKQNNLEPKKESNVCETDSSTRPFWMKTKLQGVKKIKNRERRRRQNETLRRLLAPKNALMVLNEMMPGEAIATQFKVEPVAEFGSYSRASHAFCAELNVESNVYKGYGETKMAARNAAAEQAIRDLIIKRMARVGQDQEKQEAPMETEAEAEAEAEGETVPMIQLASFALHKLFAEWECGGHRVPQLRQPPAVSTRPSANSDSASECSNPAPSRKQKVRALPEHAATMHPCMLLTYMRPQLAYRALPPRGERPQDTVFSVALDVDGHTYVGKACSKKEARRCAARAACEHVFGVKFQMP